MGKGCKEEVKLKKSGPSSAIFNAKTTRNFGHQRLHLTIMSEKDDMLPRPLPSALKFDLASKCSVSSSFQHPWATLTLTCQTTKARAATLHLPHGPVQLPMFMPVATQASLKGLTPKQLEETSCRLCLNNTYHLYDIRS